MACAIMRQLPPGFPKAMVTPVAATAAVQWYVAESDIAMFPTIATSGSTGIHARGTAQRRGRGRRNGAGAGVEVRNADHPVHR